MISLRRSHLIVLLALSALLALAGCGRATPTPLPTVAATSTFASTALVAAANSPTATGTPAPSPTAVPSTDTPTATAVPPTATAIPASTATFTPLPAPTASATQALVYAVIVRNPVNVRSGPGQGFDVVAQVLSGQRYPVLARDPASVWWQIDLDGTAGWVFGDLISVEGDSEALPVVDAPVTVAAPPPVQVYETTISIPTYPYAAFTEDAVNETFGWTYRRFERAAYEASSPRLFPWSYRAVVLENQYLRITILPDLGGRIYSVVFKPTGSDELYQNPVIKPSPWGPPEQGGWLAAGGIQWDLPVEEHGYAWGDPWGYITNRSDPASAAVTVFMPDEDHLRAEVDIALRSGDAAFTIQPRIVNSGPAAVDYQFWINALLAPGPASSVGSELRFLLPGDQVTVHSRGDESLPEPQAAMSWPVFRSIDFSRLGNWSEWLGVFERPAAHGPFSGVYDSAADEGMVRVFPPAAAPGSKVFALGWADPIPPEDYTDGQTAYVELHGGVSTTFWDQARLGPGESYTWQETWFPVAGIGGVSTANGNGAIYLATEIDGLTVGVFSRRALSGRIVVTVEGQVRLEEDIAISPEQPYRASITGLPPLSGQHINATMFDQDGNPVLHYEKTMP